MREKKKKKKNRSPLVHGSSRVPDCNSPAASRPPPCRSLCASELSRPAPRETGKLSRLRRMKTLRFSRPTEPTLSQPAALPLPDVTCLQCVGPVTSRYGHLVRAPGFSAVVAPGRVQGRSVAKKGREHISWNWCAVLMWSS